MKLYEHTGAPSQRTPMGMLVTDSFDHHYLLPNNILIGRALPIGRTIKFNIEPNSKRKLTITRLGQKPKDEELEFIREWELFNSATDLVSHGER
jgi:hypothetical protein